MQRAVIVGAGIAGLTLAAILVDAGWRVTVVERRLDWSSAATPRSAGIITTLMPPEAASLALDTIEVIESLTPNSLETLEILWIRRRGECDPVARFNAEKGIMEPLEYGPNWLNINDEVEVWRGKVAVVDTGVYLSSILSNLQRAGVELVEGEAKKIVQNGVIVNESILKGAPIVAAGPWSAGLVPNIKQLTLTYRCQVLSVKTSGIGNIVIIDDVLDFYAVCINGECLIGDGANEEIHDPWEGFAPNLEDLLEIAGTAARRVPHFWEAEIKSYWAAPCITSLDSMPLVGPLDPLREAPILLTAFNGAGVTLAPASARILASWLVRGESIPACLAAHRRMRRVEGLPEPFRLCNLTPDKNQE